MRDQVLGRFDVVVWRTIPARWSQDLQVGIHEMICQVCVCVSECLYADPIDTYFALLCFFFFGIPLIRIEG